MTQWGVDTLFNPAKRHMEEEKQRQQSTRHEVGDSSGGRRIDLTSGKVRIKRSSATSPASASSPVDDAPVDDAPVDDAAANDAAASGTD
jgi:hypothetical protein